MMMPLLAGPEKLNLLLVDDREANLQSLSQLLVRDDVRIFTALSGNEALGLMLEHDFAVVLLDVQMPGMDGFEVATLMHSNERTRQVPIIFVTAFSKDRQHIFSGYNAGAVDYLLKPLDPHVIRSKVAVFLELKRSQVANERLVESLACANAQLEETALLKSDCLAAVSHELRTPLTAMKEFCSLVHDEVVGPLNPEQRHCLEAALRNCRRLGGIIEHLVDMDSVESGRVRLRRGRVDLVDLVRERAAGLSGRCREARQILEISVSLRCGAADALADAELVGNVVWQLLDNAQKFSPVGGTIRLRVRALADRVAVEVGDQGPGIEPIHRARVFTKYTQVDRRDGPGEQGLGLGLAIATRLLELQDSRLDLVSIPGRGSIFGFSLPRYTEEAHLRAFCGDAVRQAARHWEPWCLVLVAERSGGSLPPWLTAAAEGPAGGTDDCRGVIPVAGRPVLAALVRNDVPGPVGWVRGLARQEPCEGAAEGLVWTALGLDEAGEPGAVPPVEAWNGLVPTGATVPEGAWR
jgi:signal transduction histidine kinase